MPERDILAPCGCLYQVTGYNPLSMTSKVRCKRAARLRLPRDLFQHLGVSTRAKLNGQVRHGPAAPCARRHAPTLPAWTPFVRSEIRMPWGPKSVTGRTLDEAVYAVVYSTGLDPDEVRRQLEEQESRSSDEELWINSRYQVILSRIPCQDPRLPTLVHLSIKRVDKECPGEEHFRDFQRIKNELVGRGCEGVELYPTEDRLVDTANQFHLWCFDDATVRFPFGMGSRLVTGDSIIGTVQRPFEDS